jgi:beta-glucosidase
LLLTDILRGEWGFDGIVTADYNAVVMLADYHHVAADKGHAARMALEAGLDIELPGTDCYGEPLKKDIDSGKIELSFIDRAVERILTLKFRLGLKRPSLIQNKPLKITINRINLPWPEQSHKNLLYY